MCGPLRTAATGAASPAWSRLAAHSDSEQQDPNSISPMQLQKPVGCITSCMGTTESGCAVQGALQDRVGMAELCRPACIRMKDADQSSACKNGSSCQN